MKGRLAGLLLCEGKVAEPGEAREGDWTVLVWEEPLVVERDLDFDFGFEVGSERDGVLEVTDDLDLGFDLDDDDDDDEEDFDLRGDGNGGNVVIDCVCCTSGWLLDADVWLLESELDREPLAPFGSVRRSYKPPSKSGTSPSSSSSASTGGGCGCGACT